MEKLPTSAPNPGAAKEPRVTAFVCANCGRAGQSPTARFGPPKTPAFPWTQPVREVIAPCTGRLQPEHLLKPLEAGVDLVAVIACQDDNCHFLEGACRAARRVEYVGKLLDEIGLGRDRIALFHLPGSAREDMAVGTPELNAATAPNAATLAAQVAAIAAQTAQRLAALKPNPLGPHGQLHEEVEASVSEAEDAEENED